MDVFPAWSLQKAVHPLSRTDCPPLNQHTVTRASLPPRFLYSEVPPPFLEAKALGHYSGFLAPGRKRSV